MNNHYIYKFTYIEKEQGVEKVVSATVIFCDRDEINPITLSVAIKTFYEQNSQTDKVFVIARNSLELELKKIFVENLDKTFKGIPKRQETHLLDNLYLLVFNQKGNIELVHSKPKKIPNGFQKNYLNEGLQNIFIKRGGLVSSSGSSHHYVFPSGKHCDKFLRTGNVLLVSSEIYFIAYALLRHFEYNQHSQIYCDTSSINSIAFALADLVNRFQDEKTRRQIPIESFSSYEGLYKNEISYKNNALLLISASTSANIVSYILDNHKEIDRSNIIVLYYLGEVRNYSNIKDKVICNLTQSKNNLNGIQFYQTFKSENCEFCQKGSFPVEVKGDSFLLEQPKINRILLGVKDPEKYLSKFVEQFKSKKRKNTVLKAHYKEKNTNKYEVYIDYYELLDGVRKSRYSDYRNKLNAYVNQYVPSTTKYIVHLEDNSSEELADYIIDKIGNNYLTRKKPTKLSQDNLGKIPKESEGAILVVGSCISNGKNLLYISRALRNYGNFRVVYFIGITRTKNKEYLDSLKKNLKQGTYGAESSSFIEVESIFCENNSKNSSWLKEIEFIKEFIDFLADHMPSASRETQRFLKQRKAVLELGAGDKNRGLSQELFYPRVLDDKYHQLEIRKNFAFFDFDDYVEDVTQSDIYFTISNIINGLRNTDRSDRNLKQTVYVRNIIEPGNFNRFNDGIIQASILRASKAEELIYSINPDLSSEMYGVLETIIKYYEEEQGEALLEFLYAIAIKKLSLKKGDLLKVLNLLDEKCKGEMFTCFSNFIRQNVFKGKEPTPLKPVRRDKASKK
ncbi:MAG TPA: hypothetical protein VIN08_19600 [Ohtaekwangia sp.]|uniref:hypothetical protein n=1 Tax=Ohtaekwangia sp. TaxID=2066019 RepID=UPI002F956110